MMSSSLKFIIDVGVGRVIEEWLIQQGFNVISIVKKNPEMSDSEILELAKIEDCLSKWNIKNKIK